MCRRRLQGNTITQLLVDVSLVFNLATNGCYWRLTLLFGCAYRASSPQSFSGKSLANNTDWTMSPHFENIRYHISLPFALMLLSIGWDPVVPRVAMD